MFIYIKVEVFAREFRGRLLLAAVAAARGHRVVIGPPGSIIEPLASGKLPVGLLHEKSISPSMRRIAQMEALKKRGCYITCQDEESYGIDVKYCDFLRYRMDGRTLSLVDRFFCWGEHDYEEVLSNNRSHDNKIVMTGNPRVDLWRAHFQKATNSNQVDSDKDYILIPTNFGAAVSVESFWERAKKLENNGYFREGDYERWFFEKEAKRLPIIFGFVQLVRELANSFPSITILLRPHPTESAKAWECFFSGLGNVLVSKKGDIGALIKNAKMVVHNGCTTGLEAAAVGTPVVSFQPDGMWDGLSFANEVSIRCTRCDQVIEVMNKIVAGNDLAHDASVNSILHSRLCNLDPESKLSADEIVVQWEEVIGSENAPKLANVQKTCGDIKHPQNTALLRVKKCARDFLGSYRKAERIQKFPDVAVRDVEEMLSEISHGTSRFSNLVVSQIAPNTFLVKQKGG